MGEYMGSLLDSGPSVGAHSRQLKASKSFLVPNKKNHHPQSQCPSRPPNKSNAHDVANLSTLPNQGWWESSPSIRSASSAVCATRCWTPLTRTVTSESCTARLATAVSSAPRDTASGPGPRALAWTPEPISITSNGATSLLLPPNKNEL